MADRIIRCCECGKEFIFSTGEQAFYRSKGLNDPRRCQSCRNRGKQNLNLRTISTEWKRDAIKERSKYFYDDGEISELASGEKCFVIGRKGAGKTAIADYISNINSPIIFAKKISFKNFPFNELYSYVNDSYTAPNQYITIWKYVVYSSICQLMAKNEKIDRNISSSLNKLYNENAETSLNKLIKRWTAKSFSIDILGCGAGAEREQYKQPSWIEHTEILENVISSYLDDSTYYILIDELDENYTVFPTENDKKRYFDLITSLFKAVQDIKNIMDHGLKIFPIIFLREDIFNLITDPDKNKWYDYMISLTWDVAKIRNMIKYRISIATREHYKTFDDAWYSIFDRDGISIGNKGKHIVSSFEYIDRLSQLRPRDYIEYIRECADLTLKRGEDKISSSIVKYKNRDFSSYLLNEIRDEAHSALPEFDSAISLLQIIRKQVFSSLDFDVTYKEAITKKQISQSITSEQILELFFEYGVIGNLPKMRGKAVFRFEYPNARINLKEMMIIHRGLYGALQIF